MPSIPKKKRLRFHESTQRALCRMVFFWLALMPVLGVSSYSVLRATPWYQSYQRELWQRRLSDNLGVEVHFKSIEFPSPNQFRAHDLVCSNPETGRVILTVAQVKATMDRSGWSVQVVSPELNGQQIQSAMRTVHDWFLCRPQKSASLLRLSVPELLVDDGANKIKFQNVEVGIKPTDFTSTLIVAFSLEGQNFERPASFRVDRDHIEESTKWSIESKDIAIPCCILSERFPPLRYLGSQASFKGTVAWWQKKENWQMSVQGDVHSVDLAYASWPIGKPMQGFGKLSISNAVHSDGVLREVKGVLTSDSCSVDTDWLDRNIASNMLYTNNHLAWNKMRPRAPVNQLAVQFALDRHGLTFAGVSDPKHPSLAAFVGGEAVGCTGSSIVTNAAFSDALSTYLKPSVEVQPARIADGRR